MKRRLGCGTAVVMPVRNSPRPGPERHRGKRGRCAGGGSGSSAGWPRGGGGHHGERPGEEVDSRHASRVGGDGGGVKRWVCDDGRSGSDGGARQICPKTKPKTTVR